jgi:uncharacterized protein (TIGR02145 family)
MNGVAEVGIGETIGFMGFGYLPLNATYKRIIWTPDAGSEEFAIITVDADNPDIHFIKGIKEGSFDINLQSYDGAVNQLLQVNILSTPVYSLVEGKNGTYRTYTYPNGLGTWMVDNSKEGTAAFTTYPGHKQGERGYYYSWEQAAGACPDGFQLPSTEQYTSLRSFVVANYTGSDRVNSYKVLPTTMAGERNNTLERYSNWDLLGSLWLSSQNTIGRVTIFDTNGNYSIMAQVVLSDDRAVSVRCIKE